MKYDSADEILKRASEFAIIILILSSNAFFSGCVYGPVTEKKSALDVLSEKNYQQTGSVLGVPVIKSKERNTSIEGSVYIKNLIPLKYEKLILLDFNGLTVAETTTSQDGSFNFKANLMNGDYLIKVESEEYTGETTIKVDDYQLQKIKINATPKTATDPPHS